MVSIYCPTNCQTIIEHRRIIASAISKVFTIYSYMIYLIFFLAVFYTHRDPTQAQHQHQTKINLIRTCMYRKRKNVITGSRSSYRRLGIIVPSWRGRWWPSNHGDHHRWPVVMTVGALQRSVRGRGPWMTSRSLLLPPLFGSSVPRSARASRGPPSSMACSWAHRQGSSASAAPLGGTVWSCTVPRTEGP